MSRSRRSNRERSSAAWAAFATSIVSRVAVSSFRAASANYDVDVGSGKLVHGNRQMAFWEQDWVFQRSSQASTKGASGHCLAAAGAVEAIFCTLALHTGVLPPTLNYQTPDPRCDLDYIPNEAREADARIAVSNSFGFGGHNASIVLRRFDR